MGAIGGLIGVAFCKLNIVLCTYRRKYSKGMILKSLEIIAVALVTSTVQFCLPLLLGGHSSPKEGHRMLGGSDANYGQEGDILSLADILFTGKATLFQRCHLMLC